MRSRIGSTVVLLAAFACGEDAPSIPRGGGDPPPAANPAAKPGADSAPPGGATAADAGPTDVVAPAADIADAGAGAPDSLDEVAGEVVDSEVEAPTADVVVPPGRTPRLPTSSELLGLGENTVGEAATALPHFLRDRPAGTEALLFAGKASEPSAAYAGMVVTLGPVSPIDRQWGQDPTEKAQEAQNQELLRQAMGDEAPPPVFAPDRGEDTPKAPIGADIGLVMYRLSPSGDVQRFEQKFASQEARDVAERRQRDLGYSTEPPPQADIDAIKARLEAAKKDAAAKTADACAFKASWVEGGLTKQMCFATQAALDAFTKARQAAERAAKPGTAPGTAPTPGTSPAPGAAPAPPTPPPAAPPAPVGDLTPVKVGQ